MIIPRKIILFRYSKIILAQPNILFGRKSFHQKITFDVKVQFLILIVSLAATRTISIKYRLVIIALVTLFQASEIIFASLNYALKVFQVNFLLSRNLHRSAHHTTRGVSAANTDKDPGLLFQFSRDWHRCSYGIMPVIRCTFSKLF